MNKWISVKKQLPKHRQFARQCEPILIYIDWKDDELGTCVVPAIRTGSRGKTVKWWAMFNNGSYPDSSEPEYAEIDDEFVTHWMPLPAPPDQLGRDQLEEK